MEESPNPHADLSGRERPVTEVASLTAVYEATRDIGLSDDLDRLLDKVLARAQELIGFDHCALMLYDADRRTLSVRRALGYGDRVSEVLRLTLQEGQGISGWAAAHRQAVRVGDVTSDPRYVAGLREARSNMAIPLIVENQVAGVINVESERLDAFTEEHEMLLTVLGAQAALAIVASTARERLRVRIKELDALYRISQLATDGKDLDATLQAILEVAQDLIPRGQCAILLVDDEERTLRVRAANGYAEGVQELAIPLGQGVTGRCASLGQTAVVDDLEQEAGYIPGVAGARSEIAVPLIVEGRVLGVLNAESTRVGAFGEEHVRTLSVVAQQAAIVLRSAELQDETRRLAITDPLTGLHNRRYFVERLEKHLHRAERYGERVALLLLDSDYLKIVNDRYGHHTGDRVLERIARVLEATVRESDEVARIGGDEFSALLLQADEELAVAIARRFKQNVRDVALTSDDGSAIAISCSVGVALFPEDAADAKALLRAADLALYNAKGRGRNQIAVAGPRLRAMGAAG
jgi:diguanylate cyclase (GGDEF)-like protein